MKYITIIAAIIKNEDKVLILDDVSLNMLTLPMGKVEDGELLTKTLYRELKEELGIIITQYEASHVYNFINNNKNITCHIYTVLYYDGVPANLEPKKHSSIQWLTREELLKLDRRDKIISRCLEMELI